MYEVQFNPSINKKRENNAGQETKKNKGVSMGDSNLHESYWPGQQSNEILILE